MEKSKPARRTRGRFWTWAHRASAAGLLVLLVLGRQAWFPWIKGSLTSTRLFRLVPFTDPLAGLEVMLASRSLTVTLLVSVGLTVTVAVVLGRVFCGWLCPLGLVLELNDSVREKVRRGLLRLSIKTPRVEFSKKLKYWLLAVCLMLSLASAIPVFTTISPINLVTMALVYSSATGLVIVGAVIAIEYLSRRAFCRSLCPLGALYGLLGKVRLLRVRIRTGTSCAIRCQRCTFHCPMGIQVLGDYVSAGRPSVDDSECTLCGVCIDGCPGQVLRFGMRKMPSNVLQWVEQPLDREPEGQSEVEA